MVNTAGVLCSFKLLESRTCILLLLLQLVLLTA